MTPIRLAWLVVSVLLGACSLLDAEVSDVCGWLFVLFTTPVGTVWWSYTYDWMLPVRLQEG